ncbi:hypothetical protein LINPERPRIM_LOCUS32993 [Linum perenne]
MHGGLEAHYHHISILLMGLCGWIQREFLSRVIQTITLSPTCRSVWLLARCTSYQDIPFVLRVPILGRPNSPISLTLRQQLSLSFSLLHTLIFH